MTSTDTVSPGAYALSAAKALSGVTNKIENNIQKNKKRANVRRLILIDIEGILRETKEVFMIFLFSLYQIQK
jgi:hypothetical protein